MSSATLLPSQSSTGRSSCPETGRIAFKNISFASSALILFLNIIHLIPGGIWQSHRRYAVLSPCRQVLKYPFRSKKHLCKVGVLRRKRACSPTQETFYISYREFLLR